MGYGASIFVAKAGDSADLGNGMDVDLEVDEAGKVVGNQELATIINIDLRLPSFQVLNQANARPWQFCHFLRSDGSFRIMLFAGNLKDNEQ